MLPNSLLSPVLLTAGTYSALQAEFKKLQQQRKEVVERLKTAREMGDLSENGAYKYAKFELGNTNRRLREVRQLLDAAVVWTGPTQTDVADFGATVTLKNDLETLKFMLVGPYEADPKQHRLSLKSPIGSAVAGKKVGAIIEVITPRETKTYTLLEISY